MDDARIRYSSTSSRIMGGIGIVVAVGAAFLALASDGGPSYAGVALCVFLGTACWASMVRPVVIADGSTLTLRDLVTTVTIPLAAIESVDVRLVLVVRAAARSYTSSAVGSTRRQLHRQARGEVGGSVAGLSPRLKGMTPTVEHEPTSSYGVLVQEELRARTQRARDAAGVENMSYEQAALAEQVTRTWAVPVIAVLVVSLLAFVVLLVL